MLSNNHNPVTTVGWQVSPTIGRALHPLPNLAFLLLQLVAYWEKTFKIDLYKPQIGVVNVTDVSIPIKAWLGGFSHPVPCYVIPTMRSGSLQKQVKLLGLSQTLGVSLYSFPKLKNKAFLYRDLMSKATFP